VRKGWCLSRRKIGRLTRRLTSPLQRDAAVWHFRLTRKVQFGAAPEHHNVGLRKDFRSAIDSDTVCKDRLWLSVPGSLVGLLLLNSPDLHRGTFISVIARAFSRFLSGLTSPAPGE